MGLTNIQKHLIVGLRIFNVQKDAIVGILCCMDTEERQCRLMEWMSEHEGASTPQILKQVVEIRRNTMNPNEDDNE